MRSASLCFQLSFVLTLTVSLAACDDAPQKGTSTSGGPAPAATTAAPAATPGTSAAEPPAKPSGMPELTVDADGPYLAGTRIDLAAAGGKDKLTAVVKGLPIQGSPVTLTVDKKAKEPLVAAVIEELGAAGAPKVIVKTNGRGDLPKEVAFTPQSRVSKPPGCSIAAMVLKDLSTAIWPIKGGTGKRQRKGFAGPDLTHTGEALKKEIEGCDSKTAFVASEEGVPWEDAFNIAGTVLASDEKKKIDTIVLLKDEPVAGRPVALSK